MYQSFHGRKVKVLNLKEREKEKEIFDNFEKFNVDFMNSEQYKCCVKYIKVYKRFLNSLF